MTSRTDLTARVGSVVLPNPVMTASGTSGHGAELESYFTLSELGAVVVKSLAADPWPGNPPLRVHEAGAGMLNSVGLQGPGMAAWLADDLPALLATGARVVVSIWGRRVEEYARAARLLVEGLGATASAPASGSRVSGGGGVGSPAPGRLGAGGVVAVEVNVSCPNVEDRSRVFAHSKAATAEVVAAVMGEMGSAEGVGTAGSAGGTDGAEGTEARTLPLWVKLSPNAADLVEIAGAALDAGAEALTLVNTLLGLAIDLEKRRPVLGAGGGGLSGPPVHPVAVRAVWDCRAAYPEAAIVGVGGVATGEDAVELLLAGADAVQVGTATFGNPRAPRKVLAEIEVWCHKHGIASVAELVGAAHG